ncbi:MAG: DUF4340 domain-containing protein [Ruminococcus sp.]|nr:DUF4340 domain-containing protein [Ruminococcus sp.]
MNSKLTGIIVVGVLAASLGGMLLFLEKTGGNENDSSSDESSSAVINQKQTNKTQLVDRSADDVISVKVENKYDTFEMVRSSTGKTTWVIDALDGVAASLSDENALADCAATLKSFDTVEENAQDMSKYGFDDPTAKFTVTFSDGEERTFIVGDLLPGSERYYYLVEEGSSTVYEVLTTYVQDMCKRKEDYAVKVLIAQPGADSYPEYGTLTVERKDLDYKVVIKDDEKEEGEGAVSAQVVVEPVYGYLNITNSTGYTHGMWGLTATTAEVLKPDDKQLEEYGLKDPYATVTLKGDGYDYTLKIGNGINAVDENGNEQTAIESYYCTLDGVEGADCIFVINSASLPWARQTPEDILSSLMTFNYVKDVGEIVITKGSDTDDITVTYDAEKEDVGAAELNGKELDVSSFKTFYEYLLTCPTSEMYFTDPDEDSSIMKIEIKRRDGGGDTIELFKDTGRRHIVKLNGVTSYRIESKWLDQFEKNISALEKGEKIGESY